MRLARPTSSWAWAAMATAMLPVAAFLPLLLLSASPAGAAEVDERFARADEGWTLDRRGGAAAASLSFPGGPDEPAGLRFESQGLDVLARPIDVGGEDFELVAEVEIHAGHAATWRNNGIVISFSTAPVDRMKKEDWAVNFGAVQQGMLATMTRGGNGRQATEVRPGVWQFQGSNIAPRFVLGMGGAGGHDYSAKWPAPNLAGTRLRFHALRRGEAIRFTVYHADGDVGPWWHGEAPLPRELQKAPLKWVTVQTGREATAFGKPAEPVAGNALVRGVVRRVGARPLGAGEAPRLSEPFPAATLRASEPGADHRPMLIPRGSDLEAMRKKFNDPMLVHYRAVLLRNASEQRAPKAYNTPAQGEYLTALLWAYALTNEKAYFDKCLAEIDALITVTDKVAAETSGSPGHLVQILDVSEFMGHNVTDLATAYDLLGSQLDARRRDRIRFVLTRAVKNYLDRIAAKDWWYFDNPSNTIGVGSGSMGLTAVALRYDDPELSSRAVDAAVKTIQSRYTGVRPDGSCIEGNMYWNYGMSYPVMLGYALRNTTGDDRGLLSSAALKNGQRYVEANLGGDGTMIPFNDTQPWLNGWLLCAHAGGEFDQPLMRWMADKMAAEFATRPDATFPEQDRARFAVSAFLYRDAKPAPKEFPGVPTLAHLGEVQEGVMRSDGGAFVPGMVVGVKGKGALSTHHANEDQGSFVLYAGGQFFLIDPGYFDGGALDHSLPLIGALTEAELKEPKPRFRLDPRASCPIVDAWESGTMRTMTVDATAAYNPANGVKTAKRVRRVLVLLGDAALVALDDIEPAEAGVKVTAQYQTGFATKAQGGSIIVTAPTGGVLSLRTFGPGELNLEVTARRFKRETWAFGQRPGVAWHSVRGVYAPDPSRPLVTVMVPSAPAAGGVPAVVPTVTYTADRIDVSLGVSSFTFAREGGLWKARKP